jgi:hypothetical protein
MPALVDPAVRGAPPQIREFVRTGTLLDSRKVLDGVRSSVTASCGECGFSNRFGTELARCRATVSRRFGHIADTSPERFATAD